MVVEIVRAGSEHSETLLRITAASKAHWGYPADWMAAWAGLLRIPPEYILSNEVYLAVSAARSSAGTP